MRARRRLEPGTRTFEPRAVQGTTTDIRAVQELASRLWPRSWHPGGLGWALARGQLADQVVLIDGANGPVAWVARGTHEPGDVLALADPTVPGAADAVASWLRDTATPPPRTVEVSPRDEVMLVALRHAGFQLLPGRPVIGMRRSATSSAVDADGYGVRAVEPEETSVRVEVHRAAWRPASLPYAPHHRRTVDPAATSSFTQEAYDAVRQTWLYDPALDLVVEAPDGSLVACCIAWFDPASGVAEIEPLGVVPEHRDRGLAGILCLAVAARVADLGGHEVFINTGPRPDYPAPARAYAKVGFETFNRAHSYDVT